MTKQEIKNRISEHKECCKKLAEEYRHRYNEDNTDKLALNMFYHNVIAYNDFETILSMIEDRKSMIMCFSEPPVLTEKTVEVELNRIAELEKENADLEERLKNQKADYETYYKSCYNAQKKAEKKLAQLQQENAELEHQLTHRNCLDCSNHSSKLRMKVLELEKENAELRKEISVLLSCKNCPENKGGYICQKEYEDKCLAQKIQYIKELQQENADLEKENAELKNQLEMSNKVYNDNLDYSNHIEGQLIKAKEIIKSFLDANSETDMLKAQRKAEQFISEENE